MPYDIFLIPFISMKQKSLQHIRPGFVFIFIVIMISIFGKGGWGFTDHDWELSTVLMVTAIIAAGCLFFEDYILLHRVLLLLPYGVSAAGAFWAVNAHLSSVHTTFNILVVLIGMLGAAPGSILYYFIYSYFDKLAILRFENDHPEIALKRSQVYAAMSGDDKQAMLSLHAAMKKIVNSKNRQAAAVEVVINFVNANARTREQAAGFLDMYDAVLKRDLVKDIRTISGKKEAANNLEKFIQLNIIEPVTPFERRF
jgi:hypothetical protein